MAFASMPFNIIQFDMIESIVGSSVKRKEPGNVYREHSLYPVFA